MPVVPTAPAPPTPLTLPDIERFGSLLLERARRLAPDQAAAFRRELADALFEATPPDRRPAVGLWLDGVLAVSAGLEVFACPVQPSEPRVGPVRRLAGRLRSLLFA
jgi:hypothetical protein